MQIMMAAMNCSKPGWFSCSMDQVMEASVGNRIQFKYRRQFRQCA